MASQLEVVLRRLLLPETNSITQATNDLKILLKNPEIYKELCTLLSSSPYSQVRQYAAVILRRKLAKRKHWNKLNADLKSGIKSYVLNSLEADPEKTVRNVAAQLAGSLAKHELPRNAWPELLLKLKTSISSSELSDREVGVYVLSVVADTSALQLKPYLKQLLQLLSKCLQDNSSPTIAFHSLKALTFLGSMVGTEELQIFQNLMPCIFQVIGQLASSDEDKACEALQIFDELLEIEVGVMAPHIKSLIEFCLQLGGNTSLGDDVRVKAINLISTVAQLKKKTILKHKLVYQILKVIFPIMCTSPDDEDVEGGIPYEGAESSTPTNVAAQVIDVLALHLPPEKLFHPLLQYVEPALLSQNPFERKAAYITMAVIAEGCADYIRNKYLAHFVQCLYKGIVDQHICVRNASLFALGQFAEHLQPEIGNYAQQMLPLMLQCLKDKVQVHFNEENSSMPSTTKLFYALENFCDSLGERLVPYLPSLLDKLFLALEQGPLRIQELAVSSIGIIADAVKDAILPYFDKTLGYLKAILDKPHSADIFPLQLQAIDNLAILARTVGNVFHPFVNDSIHLGLTFLGNLDDADLRRCAYGLFAAMATIIHEDMAPYLPAIIPCMVNSLTSAEGVVVPTAPRNGLDPFSLFNDLSDDEEEVDDSAEVDLGDAEDVSDCSDEDYEDDDGVGLEVENAYLREKEDTCISLKEIAQHTRAAFLPYLDKVNEETNHLLEHRSGDVRKAAINALSMFCITFNTVLKTLSSDSEKREIASKMGTTLLFKLTVMVREDEERSVAMTALEAINDLIKNLGDSLFNDRNHIGTVITVVKDVLQLKMACQDRSDEDSNGDDSDDEQAEIDQMLLEYAGEIVPTLAKVVRPGSNFAPYFAGVLSILVSKTKRKMNVAEKSFSVGILAESVAAMQEGIIPFISHLYPVFLNLAQDDDEEVRSNAIFGLGVLVEFGGQGVENHYATILQLLSNTLSKETDLGVTDNICAAVSRMIITKTDAIPLDNVFPVLIRYLPLRKDFVENLTIVRCMTHLLTVKHAEVFNHMPTILQVMAHMSHTPQVNEETQLILDNFIREVSSNCASGFETVLQSLGDDLANKLRISASVQQLS